MVRGGSFTPDPSVNETLSTCIFKFSAVDNILVNDTMIMESLLTVPLFTDSRSVQGNNMISLCYGVLGEANKFFNFVSDSCVSVNSHYSRPGINNPYIDVNIVDAIGV